MNVYLMYSVCVCVCVCIKFVQSFRRIFKLNCKGGVMESEQETGLFFNFIEFMTENTNSAYITI